MKFSLKHLGKVENGKLVFDDPKTFSQVIKDLEGEDVQVVIKKFKAYRQRSTDQNSYYWGGIVAVLAEEFGYETRGGNGAGIDEMHEIIKFHFLGTKREVKGKDGKIRKLFSSGSTASLSTGDFESLMSRIRTWASKDYGIYLLSPDEYHQKIYNEKNQV
jgi:hypothetical protein